MLSGSSSDSSTFKETSLELTRYTEPNADQKLLLNRLRL
jgi:hypothetical protein